MAHARLRQLVLVHFRLEPELPLYTHANKSDVSIIESADAFLLFLLTCIKDEDIVDYSFLSITLSTSKNDEKLAELRGRMAIPCRGRCPIESRLLLSIGGRIAGRCC